ncbi:hypothetical protein MSAN_01596900 [Mycena sanguinolenta]|uniref:Uncharacterized protein n=1 Tax=Mycena sanguinolenta TaxID=230812 RepID=A0A8H7CY37_9AGAR|nr:hypothetical protein MSAN_01596900 [Mycena sanguinolenta]
MPMLLSPSGSETESEPETEDSVLLLAAGAQSRLRRRPAVAVHARLLPDNSAPGTALLCGSEHDPDPAEDDWWDARRPAAVPFLPLPFDQERTSPQPGTRAPRTSSGCGAPIHARAHATRGGGHWVGYTEDVERTVVRLDSQYFSAEDRSALGLETAGCGCVVDGVGCAVCGNALGALHTPCHVHQSRKGQAHYVFLPSAVSPPIKDARSSQPAGNASTSGSTSENTRSTRTPMEVLWERPPSWRRVPIPPSPPRTPPPRPSRALEVDHRNDFSGVGTEALVSAALAGESILSTEQALTAFREIVVRATQPGSTVDPGSAAEALTALHRFMETATNRTTPPITQTTAPQPEAAQPSERMDVDSSTTPLPLPQTEAPPPPPLEPAASADPVVVQSHPSDLDSWLTDPEPLFVGDIPRVTTPEPIVFAQQLEPIVFSPPPTQPVPPSTTVTGTAGASSPTINDTMAATERARARITALFAHRWDDRNDFHQGSTSALPSLTRAASTSGATAPPRSLRRTSARPDLHAAATSRAHLVGRRRHARGHEAWLAAETATARPPLRRASVPDLRRRNSGGADAEVTRLVRRLRRREGDPMASTAMEVDGQGSSDGETVRAGERESWARGGAGAGGAAGADRVGVGDVDHNAVSSSGRAAAYHTGARADTAAGDASCGDAGDAALRRRVDCGAAGTGAVARDAATCVAAKKNVTDWIIPCTCAFGNKIGLIILPQFPSAMAYYDSH